MKTFYRIVAGELETAISEVALDGFTEYQIGQEPQVLIDAIQSVTIIEQVSKLKQIKDKAVSDKLSILKYDSLATVKLWADDTTFGTEATKILTWYKALTLMSITLENDVKAGTKTMPTEIEYETMVASVTF